MIWYIDFKLWQPAKYQCSAQSCLFVQCWPGIFLQQCRLRLSTICVAFAATGIIKKLTGPKQKIPKRWPDIVKTTLYWIFLLCIVVLSLSRTIHCIGFFLCNIVSEVLREHCKGFFPAKCCLYALGQHYIRFWPVQCYPKSIKTTLNRIFLRSVAWSLKDNI